MWAHWRVVDCPGLGCESGHLLVGYACHESHVSVQLHVALLVSGAWSVQEDSPRRYPQTRTRTSWLQLLA